MPPKYEVRIQTLKRAQYLSQLGYDVTIIGGSFLHNTDINLITDNKKYYKATYDGIKFIHIRTSRYNTNGVKRFYNLLEFPLRLFLLSKKFDKPDVIAQIATVPFGNIIYYIAKKYQAKFIVDVVDLWPETMVALGLISKNNPLTKLAYWAEKWLYEKADNIVFSMEGGKDYIIEKGWNKDAGGSIDLNKVHYVNNGVDLQDFDNNKEQFKIDDEDLLDGNTFKVIYLGSIRVANNLKLLIDAATILKDHKKIKFFIYGDGSERELLEKYCNTKQLKNVVFKQKWVELKYVPFILSHSSLNILNYQNTSITRFGGSQSKSFQYMASGKPICANVQMNYCPIKKYNIGIAREFKNSEDYANAILSIFSMDNKEYETLCKNARNAAVDYDYKKLTYEFEKILLN